MEVQRRSNRDNASKCQTIPLYIEVVRNHNRASFPPVPTEPRADMADIVEAFTALVGTGRPKHWRYGSLK
jgi:hypothetical protein